MRLKSKVGSRDKVGRGKEFGSYSKCNGAALKIFYARDCPEQIYFFYGGSCLVENGSRETN